MNDSVLVQVTESLAWEGEREGGRERGGGREENRVL